ncbi:MAG: DUF6498-containing protein [Patescibacteria group bacterium]
MSVYLLIIMNLVPVVQVIFFDLNIFPVILLFWIEAVIIGIFCLIKIVVYRNVKNRNTVRNAAGFLITFSFAMFIYFWFLIGIFLLPKIIPITSHGNGIPHDFPFKDLFNLFMVNLYAIKLPILALFLSNAYSSFESGSKDYDPVKHLLSRILVLHITLMISIPVLFLVGEKTASIVVLIMIKIIFDLRGLLKSQR